MNSQKLIDLYKGMLRIRRVEEIIADRYLEQEMRCPVHLCIGQEAIAVGVCEHLTSADYTMSTHRSHGHYLAKGGDLKAMLAELYGRDTGCSRGKGGSMHLIDITAGFIGATPVVGSTIPMAVGAMFGQTLQGKTGRVSVVFFGEAATEEGVFYEALNFAALKKLPVVFVCENNGYSVYSPLSVRQPSGRDICKLADICGAITARGDGNDVLAVHNIAGKAIERARQGEGPFLLEFATYRFREHVGPGEDGYLGYRSQQEIDSWKARDPLPRLRDHLLAEKAVTDAELDAILETIDREVNDAIDFARNSAYPEPDLLREHVFAP
jgi:pyruvate dehydrogenase E1 component alpha subunit